MRSNLFPDRQIISIRLSPRREALMQREHNPEYHKLSENVSQRGRAYSDALSPERDDISWENR